MNAAAVSAKRAHRQIAAIPVAPVSVVASAMGGRLGVHLDAAEDRETARRDGARTIARARRWADRLSRRLATSDISRLNDAGGTAVLVRPTLGAILEAGREACERGEGLVDITLLGARLAAEGLVPVTGTATGPGTWAIVRGRRGGGSVRRPPDVRFDLDGIAKGWIADRALALLSAWPSAVVDADGDLAVRAAPGRSWPIGVGDPRDPGALLATLVLAAPAAAYPAQWGVATSGTSVHHWGPAGTVRHHLIDPRTAAPAVTDVVQATVVCSTALDAEVMAKAAVIAGSVEALALLERERIAGAVLLTDRGEVLALPSTLALLARDGAA